MPGERIFVDERLEPLRLNDKTAGGSGRRKLAVVDWDADGRLDVLVNSQNADWLRNVSQSSSAIVLRNMGPLSTQDVAGHTSSPAVVRGRGGSLPRLLVGAEDGRLYYMKQQ
jgi:hypothetical protein